MVTIENIKNEIETLKKEVEVIRISEPNVYNTLFGYSLYHDQREKDIGCNFCKNVTNVGLMIIELENSLPIEEVLDLYALLINELPHFMRITVSEIAQDVSAKIRINKFFADNVDNVKEYMNMKNKQLEKNI